MFWHSEEIVWWGITQPHRPYDVRQIRLGPAATSLESAQSVGYCGA